MVQCITIHGFAVLRGMTELVLLNFRRYLEEKEDALYLLDTVCSIFAWEREKTRRRKLLQ
jgi:hypothetical protein